MAPDPLRRTGWNTISRYVPSGSGGVKKHTSQAAQAGGNYCGGVGTTDTDGDKNTSAGAGGVVIFYEYTC